MQTKSKRACTVDQGWIVEGELSDQIPSTVARLLDAGGPLPEQIPYSGPAERHPSLAAEPATVIGCPRHLLQTRQALLRDAASLFARLDTSCSGIVRYQDFVDRMQGLPPDTLLAYGLASADDIVRFASELWDLKYGRMPLAESAVEQELYGLAPSHTLFHESCLDHETHAGPQGRCTVTMDTRSHLTITCDEMVRLVSGLGSNADLHHVQRLRPAVVSSAHELSGGGSRWRKSQRRPVQVLVDVDKPARLGLRVVTSEWYRRSRGKHAWPDISGGSIGTITRLVRVPGMVAWHYSTHASMADAMREGTLAVDSYSTPGDGLELPGRQTELASMRARGTHASARMPLHVAQAQRARAVSHGVAFIKRTRARHASASAAASSERKSSGGEVASVSATNSQGRWAHLHGTRATYTTHDRLQMHAGLHPGAGAQSTRDSRMHAPHGQAPPPPHPSGLFVLDGATSCKPFSRKSAAFWALPHAWGMPASSHWAHPHRHWGWPSAAGPTLSSDLAHLGLPHRSVDGIAGVSGNGGGAGGEGTGGGNCRDDPGRCGEERERTGSGSGTRWGSGGVGSDEGELVAMVEWDNGAVGEYPLREHPHMQTRPAHLSVDNALCMATLAIARERRWWRGKPKTQTAPSRNASAASESVRASASVPVGCGYAASRDALHPQVFVVEAVSGSGTYEWCYSCQLDTYLHTSWLTHVGGGPPVLALRHGFSSGLCAVSNLARLPGHHQGSRPTSNANADVSYCVAAGLGVLANASNNANNNTKTSTNTMADMSGSQQHEHAAELCAARDNLVAVAGADTDAAMAMAYSNELRGEKQRGETAGVAAEAAGVAWPFVSRQEEEVGTEAEAVGGGEGCLWGHAPHLEVRVTKATELHEYGNCRFDIRRGRPGESAAAAAGGAGGEGGVGGRSGDGGGGAAGVWGSGSRAQGVGVNVSTRRAEEGNEAKEAAAEEAMDGSTHGARETKGRCNHASPSTTTSRRVWESDGGAGLVVGVETGEGDEAVGAAEVGALGEGGSCEGQPVALVREVVRQSSSVCVQRTDGGKEGWCVWGWRVEQAAAEYFEDVIDELWVGARGCTGGLPDASVTWVLMPLGNDGQEYALPLVLNGVPVDVSRVVRGWRGFLLKVSVGVSEASQAQPGAATDTCTCPAHSHCQETHAHSQGQEQHAREAGVCARQLTWLEHAVCESTTLHLYPTLFGNSLVQEGGGFQHRVTDRQQTAAMSMLVRLRLRPRFRLPEPPPLLPPPPSKEECGALLLGLGRHVGDSCHGAAASAAFPATAASASQQVARERCRTLLREGAGGVLARWDDATCELWLRELAELCDTGGAVVASAMLEGDRESGIAHVLELLRRHASSSTGCRSAWGALERACLLVLAVVIEPRSSYDVPSQHDHTSYFHTHHGGGVGGAHGCGHPWTAALVAGQLAWISTFLPLRRRIGAGVEGDPTALKENTEQVEGEGSERGEHVMRGLAREILAQMEAQPECAALQELGCRVLAAIAALRVRVPSLYREGAERSQADSPQGGACDGGSGARGGSAASGPGAMTSVAARREGACEMLAEEGAVTAIRRALLRHGPTAERVVGRALQAALQLEMAGSTEVRVEVVGRLGPEMATEVMARYGSGSSASNAAARLLCLWLPTPHPSSPHTPERGNGGEEGEEDGSLRLDPAYGVLVQALLRALAPGTCQAADSVCRGMLWACALMALRRMIASAATAAAADVASHDGRGYEVQMLGVETEGGCGEVGGKVSVAAAARAVVRGFVELRGLELLVACAQAAHAEEVARNKGREAGTIECGDKGWGAEACGHAVMQQGQVGEEVCGFLSALVAAEVLQPEQVLAAGGGELVRLVLQWMENVGNKGGEGAGVAVVEVAVQATCLLANLVAAPASTRLRHERNGGLGESHPQKRREHEWGRGREGKDECVAEQLVRLGAIRTVVSVQACWQDSGLLVAHALRFLCALATVPAPCNVAFAGGAGMRPQVPNYFLADDIRRTGVHDTLLACVLRYQHPLLAQAQTLHSLVATPMWGESRVLTKDARRKTARVLGYASARAPAYSAASALTSVADMPAFPRVSSLPKQRRQLPPQSRLEQQMLHSQDRMLLARA